MDIYLTNAAQKLTFFGKMCPDRDKLLKMPINETDDTDAGPNSRICGKKDGLA